MWATSKDRQFCTCWTVGKMASCSNEPPQKKAKLSLKLKRKREPLQEVGNSSRFASHVKDSDYNEAAKGVVPANTKCSLCLLYYVGLFCY